MAGPIATFTSGNSRFTACAITWEVEWRSVGRGSGMQSNSPAKLRCRASSDMLFICGGPEMAPALPQQGQSAIAVTPLIETKKHHRAAPGDARNSPHSLTLDQLTIRTPTG